MRGLVSLLTLASGSEKDTLIRSELLTVGPADIRELPLPSVDGATHTPGEAQALDARTVTNPYSEVYMSHSGVTRGPPRAERTLSITVASYLFFSTWGKAEGEHLRMPFHSSPALKAGVPRKETSMEAKP